MLIVLDLNRKITGYNLYKNLFYNFKNKILYINEITFNELNEINYDELKNIIEKTLYNNYANTFEMCILYELEKAKEDPVNNSAISYINKIKKNIIEPLSNMYIFNKLYFLVLDDVSKNEDGIPINDNIKNAINFDKEGYFLFPHEKKYIFSQEDFIKIDKSINKIKDQEEIKKVITSIFKSKLNEIEDEYNLLWYKDKMDEIHKSIIKYIDNVNNNSPSSILNPTNILQTIKNYLKINLSTYAFKDTVFMHFDLLDKYNNLNKEIIKYRGQLKILSTIILLPILNNETDCFKNKILNYENHWKINLSINEDILSRLLFSYDIKLKEELENISNYINEDIEIREFLLKNLNFETEIPKIETLPILKFSLLGKPEDYQKLDQYNEYITNRYIRSIDTVNKRMGEITKKFRIQKKADALGKIKNVDIATLTNEIIIIEKAIRELQQSIAYFVPIEIISIDKKVLENNNKIISNIKKLLSQRINKNTIMQLVCIITITIIEVYFNLNAINTSTIIPKIILILLIPIYFIIQLLFIEISNYKIKKETKYLKDYNDNIINDLYAKDLDKSNYIINIYNLTMKKKYLYECQEKLNEYNKKYIKCNYHINEIKKHLELNKKMISLLNLNSKNINVLKIDKIGNIDYTKGIEETLVYCPLSILLIEDIKPQIICDGKNIEIKNTNLIGYIDKINITQDKE